jgi:methyl-accepting chemotaxis protein
VRPLRAFLRRASRILRPWQARESSSVLPVIRRQLQQTSRQVEEAVVGVCGSFTGIAARARDAVAESSKLLEGESAGQEATVEGAIETSQRTIAGLLERTERAGKLSATAVARMEEVSQTVAGIEDLLAQIQRIAFSNKLVALNAKIEAVHVGELGSGFEVVAEEISRQSDQSTELVGSVSERIQKMRARVVSAAGDLRDFLKEDREQLEESRKNADGALTMLLSLHRRMRDSLERSASENSRLAGDIASAVVSLQFQDAVKQRLEHVVEALIKLEQGEDASTAEMLATVHSSYTMESERVAHHGSDEGAAGPAVPQADPDDMEVELF